MKALTPRGKALRWWTNHRHCTEQPPGSNRDRRKDGITAAQRRLADWLVGLAWCGMWYANGLIAAGVKGARNPALASVAACEDLARARKAPFGRGWTRDSRKALRGDAVILFGRGVHIEGVRKVYRLLRLIRTEGGNTGTGNAGSQSNGGTSASRWRRFKDVHGFCLADFPNR